MQGSQVSNNYWRGISAALTGFIMMLIFVWCCSGCAGPGGTAADRIGSRAGFEKTFLRTREFTLTAFWRSSQSGVPLNLYIEGDGAAWISRSWRSDDPTPRDPVALALAALDPGPNVACLARPGQYAAPGSPRVDPAFWSDRRFSPAVVAALGEAADLLLAKTRAKGVNLIGYSGGAALAVLLAAQRDDVLSLRTVAGNMDPEAVNRHHRVSPLAGSLDPMDAAMQIRDLPQLHFAGTEDAVVPPFAAGNFIRRQGGDEQRIVIVPGAGHGDGWRERWRELLGRPLF